MLNATPNPLKPARRAGGRPAKPVDERTVVATMRLTPARKLKLQRLGSAWLARHIDAAELPPQDG